MSNDLRDAVWQNGPTDPTMRFVLMSLCDRADKNGYCWPSHDDTSRRTGFTKKTVRTATKKLEADGWIRTEVRYASGRERSSNGIYINADMLLGVVAVTTPSAAEVGNELPQVEYVLPPGVVTVTPESFIESVNEKEDEAASPAPAIEPAAALREHFVKRTAIQPNDRTGTYERDWQEPLKQLLALAGGDVGAAVALLDRALAVARGDNERRKTYTVSCPRSLVGIAANLAATQETAAATADADALWRQALAVVTGTKTSDNRLLVAIRAIGAERIRMARESDAPRLKQELAHGYHRGTVAAA